MNWAVILSIIIPYSIAEIVVKSNGMLSMRMSSETCRLQRADTYDLDENKGIYNLSHARSACGWYNKKHSLRISGGDIYPENEFPFIAALVKCLSRKCIPFCGGSILTRSHILTAAHCTDDQNPATLFVLVGAYDLSKQSTRIQVASITRHNSYDRNTLMNDIAVLSLLTPISFSTIVGPVCLPSSELEDGEEVKILGWGAEEPLGKMSPKPREMNTNILSISTCSKQWSTCVRPTKPIQICTLSKDAAPCQGDSGGPVVWLDSQTNQYSLVGIVSFGPNCTESKAAVHTKVTAFLDWIYQTVHDL